MVNYLAIVGAGVAAMAVGWLWYGVLFGKTWMKLSGMKPSPKKNDMTKSMGVGFLGTLVMAYVLSLVLTWAAATTVVGALYAAAWVWLGFQATKELGTVLWQGKSVNLYLLNALHDLVTIAVMAAILVLWV